MNHEIRELKFEKTLETIWPNIFFRGIQGPEQRNYLTTQYS